MNADYPNKIRRHGALSCGLRILLRVCGAFALSALQATAQTNPLVVSTVAGLANFGSADGIDAQAKFLSPTGVAVDAGGNVYVADANNFTIREISTNGVVTTIAGQPGVFGSANGNATNGASFLYPYGVAVDNSNNVYVADNYYSLIRKISNGTVTTIGTNATFNSPYGVAVDKGGNVYVADTGDSEIWKITPGGAVTNIGTNANPSFNSPTAVAVDNASNVYVADTYNSLVRVISPAGLVTTIGTNANPAIEQPYGIAVDGAGNVYVSDYYDEVIRVIPPNGGQVYTLAGNYGFYGDGDGGYASTDATFDSPWGVAVDSGGNVYVGDYGNGNVRKITPSGALSTLAGPDESHGILGPVDGTTTQARFYQPFGVATDLAGNMYVADSANNCIRSITPAGKVSTLAGSPTGSSGSSDGTNTSASFYFPTGVCIDAATNLYVADYYNSTIRKITPDSIHSNWVTTTIAGQAGNNSSNNAIGTNALFYYPYGIAVDHATNLYVTDYSNTCVRKLTNSAGNWIVSTLSAGSFSEPDGITVDNSTNVYVADAGANVIFKITPAGTTTSYFTSTNFLSSPQAVAASGSNLYVANADDTVISIAPQGLSAALVAGLSQYLGSADGLGTNARFDSPEGLAVDASSNLYVADTLNNTIRKGTISTTQTAVLTVNTSPAGLPIGINGTNFLDTPQVMALPVGSTNVVTNIGVSGYSFTNWSTNGIVVSTSPGYTFVLASNTTYLATFFNTYTYSVSASPNNGGTVSPSGTNTPGSSITVLATNNSGFAFTGWTSNGVATATTTNYTVTLNTNITLVANFAPLYTYTVSALPSNGGTVSPGGTNESGSSITVFATNNSGFAFTGWTSNGVATVTTTNYTFSLNTNVTVVANFTPLFTYTVSASPSNGGTVSPGGTNQSGSSITVIATNNSGFAFTGWTSNGIPTVSTTNYTFTLDTNVTVVANFTPLFTYTVSASPSNGGTVSPGGTNQSGSSITVIATNNSGFAFTGWTSNGIPTVSTTNYTFTLDTNVTVVANFTPLFTYTVSASPSNGGTVSPGGTNQSGSSITVIATNNSGFAFTGWTSNGIPTVSTTNYTFTLNTNVTVVANFTPLYTYTVSASPSNGGTVSPGGTNESGSSITVIATNNSGFAFTGWTSNGIPTVSTTNYTFTIDTNVTVVANFTPLFTYTVSASPSNGGTVSPGGTNESGSSITVIATNNSGFAFTGWTSNGIPTVSTTNYTFTLDTNVTVVANFTPLFTYTVSASPSNGGTVSPGGTNESGSSITVIATNNSGFAFTGWTSNGIATATTTNYTFTLDTNVTLVASFATTSSEILVYNGTNAITNGQMNPVDFGSVPQGFAGPILAFTVTNLGGQSLTLTNISVPSNYVWNTNFPSTITNFPSTIPPGSNGVFTVQLGSTNIGTNSGNITLINNDPVNGSFTFAVTGVVTPPSPQMEVLVGTSILGNGQITPVNFGSVQLDQTGPTVVFVVTNLGGQTLNLTNISVPSGFTLDPGSASSIAPLSSGTFSVQLNTNAIGTNSGSITITNNDTNNNPFTFPVTGIVTPQAPQIGLLNGPSVITNGQTTAADFGSVPQRQNGPIVIFTITNTGALTLDLTNVTVPLGYTVTTNPPPTIGAGSNGMFSVQLDTAAAGTFSGNILITNNDPTNNPFVFGVTGIVTPTYTYTVSALPANGGTVGPGGTNVPGSSITVIATNNSGFAFTGWTSNGLPAVSTTNYTFSLNTNVTVVANFTPLFAYTVSASPANGGTVSPGGTNESGSSITLFATNNTGFAFTGWTSNGVPTVTTTNYTFTLNTNVTVVANFTPLFTYTVSASPSNGGTVSPGGTNESGSSITVIATNNSNFAFTGWTSNGVPTVTTTNYTFTLNTNVTVVANFTPLYTYTVSASPSNGGTISPDGTNESGSSITVIATNNSGFAFTGWTSNGIPTVSTTNYTFTLNTNVTVVANFAPLFAYTVSASPANGGTVSSGGTNESGSSITVIATNNSGFAFTGWTSNGISTVTTTNYTFTLNTNVTVVANFTPLFTYTVSASPSNGGTVSPGGTNESGSSITVIATNNSGFAFTGWTSNGISTVTTTNYTFTLNTNVSVVANFTPLFIYTVGASPANGGTVSPAGTNQSGSSITVFATNNSGFVFTGWTSNGVATVTTTNYTFTLNTNVTVVANFTPLYSYTVTASPSNGGTVSAGGTNESGSSITVIATNNSGFAFTGWSSNGVHTVSTTNYTFTLNTNVTIVANFTPLYAYTVSASPTNGGTVSPGGTNQSGSSITLFATNNSGFAFTGWTSNGVPTVSTTNYTFTLNTNVTVVANFTPLYTYTVAASPPNGGTVSPGGANESGTSITVFATNNGGFAFTGWTSNGVSTVSTTNYTFTLNTNVTVVANFTPFFTYTVSASPLSGGTFSASGTGNSGASKTVVATNNSGFAFTGWTSNGVAAASTTNYTFTLNTNVTLVASFMAVSSQIQVSYNTNIITNNQTNEVNFGSVSQTQAGSSLTFTITNSGGQTLVVSNITVPSGYTLETNYSTNITAGGSGTFSVQLTTNVLGAYPGDISIANNSPVNPFSFPITSLVTGQIIALGGNLDFGVVPVGSSATGTLVISNNGNTNLTVTSISFSNAVFSANWNGGQITNGNPQQVTVTFAPTSPTNYSGLLTVHSDATSGARTIGITAFGANTNLLLTIITNGIGTVTPNDAKLLKLNAKVTLKAVAGSGMVFSNWVGSTNSTNNPLTFFMKSNTIVQVNFITNPFLPFVGTYNGLFWATSGNVTEQTAGMLKGLALTSKGTYSGSLLINGASKGLSGSFNVDGQAGKTVSLGGQAGNVQVVLTLTSNQPAPQLTGTVSGNGWISTNLVADRATNNNQISPQYTILIPPDTNISSPAGDGYAVVTGTAGNTKTAANAKITGFLSDGTAFSQSVAISQDGFVPVYANLYSGRGLILGWLNLEPTNDPGSIAWIHPSRPGLFPSAFASTNPIALSPWTNSASVSPFLTNLIVIEMSASGALQTNNFSFVISNNFKLGKTSGTGTLTGSLNPKTGQISATFDKITGNGVILLNQTNGGGYFLTKTISGAILLSP